MQRVKKKIKEIGEKQGFVEGKGTANVLAEKLNIH